MKAGLDFGTSLIKAVWMKDGVYRFASTADSPLEEIAVHLSGDGVQTVRPAGIGFAEHYHPSLDCFTFEPIKGDPIETELQLQSEGTKRLLELDGYQGARFLVVSIGTGTSYTLVTENGPTPFPIGNPSSGKSILGLGLILGAKSYEEIATESANATPLDLCLKDMRWFKDMISSRAPSEADMIRGEFVVAHYGKATAASTKAEAYASQISVVAVDTIRDLLILKMIPGFQPPKDIVYVGSTVPRTPLLKNLLQSYSLAIGKTPHFPSNGEFALAMGAYHHQA